MAVPKTQRAIVLHTVGSPVVLEERPVPEPGEGQLLVKITVAGLNPHDQKVRDYGLFFDGKPYIMANDVAGEVVKLGPGSIAAKFAVGEHVFSQAFGPGPDTSGLQQYALLDARFTAKVADTGVTDDEAATIPGNAIAEYIGLFHATGLGLPAPTTPEAKSFDYASQSFLVIGGGSNTGHFAIELAKLAGFGRIVTVAGLRNEAELRAIGATHVVDRHADNVLEQIRAIVGDDLIYAVDVINDGEHQELGVAALSNSKKGLLATLLPAEGSLDEKKIGPKKAGYERRFTFGASALYPELTTPFWENLPRWIRNGDLTPTKYQVVEGLDPARMNGLLDLYKEGKGAKFNVHP
ncbi:conserved hypothetical protein [Paecilomyces variotii No. 5]|uniref:Enoyl reductase (ER) domain-containing protein n=1 Tax=Byssochlamys spectabilis (strain No. 5 / NBRC 109023) TaxID=1356009 RepID=V5FV28_BYSSN|nr:conserved hypothetical protein [Paecilomyces variotii No. 5]